MTPFHFLKLFTLIERPLFNIFFFLFKAHSLSSTGKSRPRVLCPKPAGSTTSLLTNSQSSGSLKSGWTQKNPELSNNFRSMPQGLQHPLSPVSVTNNGGASSGSTSMMNKSASYCSSLPSPNTIDNRFDDSGVEKDKFLLSS